nr:hypothetical protein [Tanacetum cinerariifolium]
MSEALTFQSSFPSISASNDQTLHIAFRDELSDVTAQPKFTTLTRDKNGSQHELFLFGLMLSFFSPTADCCVC